MNAKLEHDSSSRNAEHRSNSNDNDCSLAPTNRLLHQAAYQQVFLSGTRSKTAHFVGHILANSNNDRRLGLAISKKACRRAVDRNRVKRLVREYFRQHKTVIAAGDYVILAKHGVAMKTRKEVSLELASLFSKLTLLATDK